MTTKKTTCRPTLAWVLAKPWRALAFGMGSGVIYPGPGTWGTLWAWAIWLIGLRFVPDMVMPLLLVFFFILGVWLCQRTGQELGVDDHSGMNWDEAVAFWLVLWLLPSSQWWMQLAAFALFRVFDIVKPAPIRQIDQRVSGGFGVMIDDIIAAVYALAVLYGVHFIL